MSRFFEMSFIAVSFFIAYGWSQHPVLNLYSLQLSLVMFIFYFLFKRLNRSRWHSVLPAQNSLETGLLILSVSVLVGRSGGLSSVFLPLFHLLMFISVLTLSLPTNLVKMSGLMLFLWSTTTHPLANDQIISFISFPLLIPLMLFARWEFEQAKSEKALLQTQSHQMSQQETTVLLFLSTFVKPKLHLLQAQLGLDHPDSLPNAQKQLALLLQETEGVIQEVDQTTDEHELPQE